MDDTLDRAFVTNSSDNTVSVIDLTTNAVIDTVPVGSFPLGAAADPAENAVFVVNDSSSGTVSVLDPRTDAVTDTISVGSFPHLVSVDPVIHRAYVNNSNNVSVIDTATDEVVDTLAIASPVSVAVDPSRQLAYVLTENADGSGAVSTIDESNDTVIGVTPIPGGNYPLSVAIDPSTQTSYVAEQGTRAIAVIDEVIHTVVKTISLNSSPVWVSVDPDEHAALVASSNGTVSVLDTTSNTITSTLTGFGFPYSVTIDAATHDAYVANVTGNSVSVLRHLERAVVSGVAPKSGPMAGGQQVIITGQHFTGATKVVFGKSPASSYTVDSDTQITATTPDHPAGVVQVRVHTVGLSARSAASRYRYLD